MWRSSSSSRHALATSLLRKGDKVVNVRPRQTRIGYGAFVNRANDIFNQRGELVARGQPGCVLV